MRERQAKDGTVYQEVSPDQWAPITRKDKQGNVYKKMGQDAWSLMSDEKPEASIAEKAHAAVEGVAKSVTMGALPYVKAATSYATDKLVPDIEGRKEYSFDERVEQARAQGEEVKEKAPGYHLAGEMAGFVAPGMAASKVVGKAAQALSGSSKIANSIAQSDKLLKLASEAKKIGDVEKAAKLAETARRYSKASGLIPQTAKLAAEGGLVGAAYTPETGFTDMKARGEAALTGAATGAVIPAALKGAGQVAKGTSWTAKQVGKAPVWLAKKMLSSAGGVSEDVINRYLQNPERVRNAKSFDDLYENVTKIVGQMGDDLDKAKVDFESANKHLDDVTKSIKTSRIEGKEKALELVRVARANLDESFNSSKESLRQQASPSNIEPQVSDAVGKLKNKVTQGSKESFEILGNELAPATKAIQSIPGRISELSKRGSGASQQVIPKLQSYGDKIFKSGSTDEAGNFKLPAKEIKRFIQDLDSDIGEWSKATGSFDDQYIKELKALRNSLDEELKLSNPTYKTKMESVAKDTALLKDASKKFGEPGRAVNRMANLEKPSAKADKETLLKLAEQEGDELIESVNKMTSAQRTLQSPIRMEGVKASLPETQALRSAEMQAASAKRLAKPNSIQDAINKSAASFKAKSAEQKLAEQKELFNKFKTWGEQGAESKLQQVARGKKYATQQLSELSKLNDEDFVEAVKAASDAAAFNKTMFSGSRNVNLWAVLGSLGQSIAGKSGVGAAGGAVFGGPVGMAIGAVTGALMDNYGPRVTKQILDGVLAIKGPITESAIVNMKIPDKAKLELVRSFKSTLVAERAADASKEISQKLIAEEKLKGRDKWANDGFEKLKGSADPEKIKKYERMKKELLSSKKSKEILSQLSELEPGSKAYENAVRKIDSLEEAK